MRKVDVLTNFTKFKRLCDGIEYLKIGNIIIGTPEDCKDTYEYVYKQINATHPNLNVEFLQKFDNLLLERASYRFYNRIKYDTDEERIKDDFVFVQSSLNEYIDPLEEYLTLPKNILTNSQFNEVCALYEESHLKAIRYIFDITHNLSKARDYISMYITKDYS